MKHITQSLLIHGSRAPVHVIFAFRWKICCTACSGGKGQVFKGKDGWEHSRGVKSKRREQASSLVSVKWGYWPQAKRKCTCDLLVFVFLLIVFCSSCQINSCKICEIIYSITSCCVKFNSSFKQPELSLSPTDDCSLDFFWCPLEMIRATVKTFKIRSFIYLLFASRSNI